MAQGRGLVARKCYAKALHRCTPGRPGLDEKVRLLPINQRRLSEGQDLDVNQPIGARRYGHPAAATPRVDEVFFALGLDVRGQDSHANSITLD